MALERKHSTTTTTNRRVVHDYEDDLFSQKNAKEELKHR